MKKGEFTMKIRYLMMSLITFLGSTLGCNHKVDPAQSVQVDLQVKQGRSLEGGFAFNATVTLTNTSDQSVLLNPRATCAKCTANGPIPDIFQIYGPDGMIQPYWEQDPNSSVKPAQEDMIELAAGEARSFTVDLDHSYTFPDQKQSYKVKYHALHLQPTDGDFADFELQSNEVTAVFVDRQAALLK